MHIQYMEFIASYYSLTKRQHIWSLYMEVITKILVFIEKEIYRVKKIDS